MWMTGRGIDIRRRVFGAWGQVLMEGVVVVGGREGSHCHYGYG